MKKLVSQSLLTIAGASLLILHNFPFKAIAAQNSTIDRYLQNSPSGLALATSKQRSYERLARRSKTLIAELEPGEESGGFGSVGGGGRGGGFGNTRPNRGAGSNAAVRSVAREFKIDPNKFGRFIEEEKYSSGRAGNRSRGGDYTYEELREKAQEFIELEQGRGK